MRASVVIHLALLELLRAVQAMFPATLDVIGGEVCDSIERLSARLRALISTGVDPATVEFDTGDFEAMYTNLDWPRAIEMVQFLGAIIGWTPVTLIRIVRKEGVPRGKHPGGCSALKYPDKRDSFLVTFGEVLHLIMCVCRYGLFVAITCFGSFLVETILSILMGTQMAPELANCVGAAARFKLISEVHRGVAPSFFVGEAADNSLREIRCPFTHHHQLYHSGRYIDDLQELVWGSDASKADHREWLFQWYLLRTGLRLIFADPGEFKPWLAIAIRAQPELRPRGWTWRFRPYSKPGNSHAFTHFSSYVPIGAKIGIVIGKLLSVENRCDNLPDMRQHWRIAELRLQHRGYPIEFTQRTVRRWLDRRRVGGRAPTEFHSVLSQDKLGESFVVLDYCESFEPSRVKRQISDSIGIDCKIAIRYHRSVGDTLRGQQKLAIPSLTALGRVRPSVVPPALAHEWANA